MILFGWNGDALVARQHHLGIQYVLPREGTMLWADSLVVSAASDNQYTAQVFINFLLRPEISAQIVSTYYYPTANEAARSFLDPSLLNDRVIYPPPEYLTKNSFYAPLSPAGQKLYDEIGKRFMQANP